VTLEDQSLPKVPDEVQSAKAAGLRYTVPNGPGIRRIRKGKGFSYLDPTGRPLRNEDTLARIRSLVIPPAWSSVWVNPDPNGHIQAVGRDARGRKQYRYHPKYRAMRDVIKFDRMSAFGKVLPRIRRAVTRDLNKSGLPKEKVLAAVVSLLEETYIRVGNEEYAEENGSFGLTTLRNRHLQVFGDILKFQFSGKSAQHHEITIKDARLARILRKCKDLPGSALFEYLDGDGSPQQIDSGDVNEYLRQISGGDFTAKDFRTWGGTCLAASFLLERSAIEAGAKPLAKTLVEVVKGVASKLGNKPATCKKYYIHPIVMECYSLGTLAANAERYRSSQGKYLYEKIVLSLVKSQRRRSRPFPLSR
jgi:DNA topoisomerase-1